MGNNLYSCKIGDEHSLTLKTHLFEKDSIGPIYSVHYISKKFSSKIIKGMFMAMIFGGYCPICACIALMAKCCFDKLHPDCGTILFVIKAQHQY